MLSEAVSDFVRQASLDRKLVILHDGDEAIHAGVYAIIVAAHASPSIRIERAPPGPRLRELRKMGIPFTPATPGGYHRTMESAVHPIPGTDYPRTFSRNGPMVPHRCHLSRLCPALAV